MARWQILSWLLRPLDLMNGVNELLSGCAQYNVGPTITTTYYQKQTYIFLFCFQLIIWLEFKTNLCPVPNLGMFVASERRLTDSWVKQSIEMVCLISNVKLVALFLKFLYCRSTFLFQFPSAHVAQRYCWKFQLIISDKANKTNRDLKNLQQLPGSHILIKRIICCIHCK